MKGANRLRDRRLDRRVPVRTLHEGEPEPSAVDNSASRRAPLRWDWDLNPAACFCCLCVSPQNRIEFVLDGCFDTLVTTGVANVVTAVAGDPSACLVHLPKCVRL